MLLWKLEVFEKIDHNLFRRVIVDKSTNNYYSRETKEKLAILSTFGGSFIFILTPGPFQLIFFKPLRLHLIFMSFYSRSLSLSL